MRKNAPPPGTRPEGVTQEREAAQYVQSMFARVAPHYDFLNHLLSFSQDKKWRRRTAHAVAARLASPEARALDLCSGTGDLAVELAHAGAARIVASDFVHLMLVRAAEKAQERRLRIELVEADALQLPFADETFEVVTAAFGFRNLANYQQGLEEIYRVLKRGGEAAILEFSLPRSRLFGRLYGVYFRRVLPWIGGVISGERGPYSYLPASVEKFPDCEEFARWMEKTGFGSVRFQQWTGGTVALHQGQRP